MYYGALRRTPYKWLNLMAAAAMLLPGHDIVLLRYFTAIISARLDDPSAPERQQAYLRALRTLPNVSIHLGQFTTHKRRLPRASSPPGAPEYVEVLRTDEKGTDVNIATHLLADGYEARYDCAVLVTNDSDLLEPVRIVRGRLAKKIGIINPHTHPSKQLKGASTFMKQLRSGVLAACQLPTSLTDEHGTITKPEAW